MRKSNFTGLTVIGTVLALALSTAPLKAASAAQNQLHQLQSEVNNATKAPQQWEAAMHTISVQTGVPRAQLRALRQKYPTVEPSAVLIASVLADETKKAPEQFLKQAIAGHKWDQIARQYNVPLEKIDTRLERIQKALGTGATGQPQAASAPENRSHRSQ